MTGRGLFITLEGIDRSGKSTQAARLAASIDGALLVREPGGTQAGEQIRSLVKDPSIELSPRAEALLFAAARAELVDQVIKPALAKGRTVISDRFTDSSVAYQGGGRGLGDHVERLNRWATAGLVPDITILIEVSAEAAARRGTELDDRFEDEGASLQNAVADAYRDIAAANPDRVVVIAGDRSPDEVARDVLNTVETKRSNR